MDDVPDLPFNKDYHVFLCYSSEDENIANVLVKKLEMIGVLCCFHSRDFTPGEEILRNMDDSIEKSVYVVILLSEYYNNSEYCSHETSVALHSKIQHRTGIIPVKIEPCEIPKRLSHMTYIDCEEGTYDDLHLKILNYIVKRDSSLKMLQRLLSENQSECRNVLPLLMVEIRIQCHQFLRLKDNLQAVENVLTGKMVAVPAVKVGNRYRVDINQDIRKQHRQVSDVTFELAERITNSAMRVRMLQPIKMYRCSCCSFCLFGLVVWMIIFLIALVGCLSGSPIPDITKCKVVPFIIVISSCLVILWLIMCCCSGCTDSKRERYIGIDEILFMAGLNLNKRLWERINRHIFWKRRLLMFYTDTYGLVIMQYNVEPCLSYFCRRIRNGAIQKQESETDEDCARRLFHSYLSSNTYMLAVPVYTEQRHNTVNHAPCLCLLVEKWNKAKQS